MWCPSCHEHSMGPAAVLVLTYVPRMSWRYFARLLICSLCSAVTEVDGRGLLVEYTGHHFRDLYEYGNGARVRRTPWSLAGVSRLTKGES